MEEEKSLGEKIRSILKSKKGLAIIAGVTIISVLFVVFLFSFFSTNTEIENKNEEILEKEEVAQARKNLSQQFSAPFTLVYGTFTESEVKILAYDLEDHKEYLVTSLPTNIKRVTVIGKEELLYIAKTNEASDYGESIQVKNTTTDQVQTLYNTDSDFGIDDYVISSDKRYVVVWEVKLADDNILLNGFSRVRKIDRQNPQNIHTIYNEQITEDNPAHYPLAVTSEGEIVFDRFLPNSRAGWSYGVSVTDSSGLTQEITTIQNGSYGTQPSASHDGKMLVFAGYDGSQGPGAEIVDGFRRALIAPNTIETFNIVNRQRIQINGLSNSNSYTSVGWTETPSTVLYTQITDDPNTTGKYLLNIDRGQSIKLQYEEDEIPITALTSNQYIVGQTNSATKAITANLGRTYSFSYAGFAIYDITNNEKIPLMLSEKIAQFIEVIPHSNPSTFSILDADTITEKWIIDTEKLIERLKKDSLQLVNIPFKKIELEEKREKQQSNPPPQEEEQNEQEEEPKEETPDEPPGSNIPKEDPGDAILVCEDIAYARCNNKYGAKGSHETREEVNAWNNCFNEVVNSEYNAGNCRHTPLYLYGPKGLRVDIKIGKPIFNSNISVTENTFSVTLSGNGKIATPNTTVESIDYDYLSTARLRPPLHGKVVARENVKKTVHQYATKLGLNEKETQDLGNDIARKTTGEYVFLSFYSQNASKFILPLSFTPHPDTYINYVFYVRNLNSPQEMGYSPKAPTFPPTEERGRLTAVEVSVIAE